MRQELTAEVASTVERVWQALVGDLAQGGDHVRVVERERPSRLRLDVGHGPGERLLLSYELSTLDDANTAVRATIQPVGPRYLLKRVVTFGSVDRGYLDVLAVGLQNLRVYLEGDACDESESQSSRD